MTVAVVIYGFARPFADFNATHAGNPLWPGHAKFHVVWQVIITFGLAVLGSYLLWAKNAAQKICNQNLISPGTHCFGRSFPMQRLRISTAARYLTPMEFPPSFLAGMPT